MKELPFVSVIMPVLNEERYIEHSLGTLLGQDYPADKMEIIVADGLSTDRTRDIIKSFQAKHPNIRLVDNPQRIVSPGLNRAIDAAQGEVVARMDGHNEFPKDYLRRVVELREQTGADNAGGVLVPTGNGSYISQAVASAYYSPLGIGGAQRGHANGEAVREVDAVHGGCWRRDRLLEIGKFDEQMVRNQDDELSFRFRKNGGKIVQSSTIRMKYAVRNSFRKLFWQFAQYGYWKVRVVQKHPRQASARHFVPALFVLSLTLGLVLSPLSSLIRWCVTGLASLYLSVLALASLHRAIQSELRLWPGILWALIMMQIGYGWGFLMGWLRKVVGRLPTDRVFERLTR